LAALHRFDALGARDQLSQAVAADPAFPLAHAALADALRELGFATQAREESARAFELAGNLPRAERLAVEGRYHETAGRWDQAIDTYRTLVTLFPDDPEPFLRLAGVQIEAGRARQALGTLDELRQQIAGIEADPRLALAEAEAASALSDFERALAAARRAVAAARHRGASLLVARALLVQWWSLRTLGRLDAAAQPAAEARKLFAAAGDRGGVALALNAQATLLADQGRFAEAIQADLQALETFRQLGDRRHMSWSLNNLGRNLRGRGDLSGARRMYEESLTLCRELEDASCTARAEANLGRMRFEAGELAAARELHEDSLRLRREIGEERGVAGAVVNLAVVELAQGRLAEAEAGFHEAERSFLALGDKQSAAHVADFLGATLLQRGDLAAARQARERALLAWQELGSRDAAATRLALAELELAGGRFAAAASALEALLAPARQGELGGTAPLAWALLANARLALGDEPSARRALTEAHKPSTRQLVLADRLSLAIWTARAEGMLDLEASRPLAEVAAEARAAGLPRPELHARLVAGELALRRDARAARQQLGVLAREAEAGGYGRIAARARFLLASPGPG
jgi:tetratricopeptide (TPR) repeat protein